MKASAIPDDEVSKRDKPLCGYNTFTNLNRREAPSDPPAGRCLAFQDDNLR